METGSWDRQGRQVRRPAGRSGLKIVTGSVTFANRTYSGADGT